jgi:hypothetical protein
MPALNGTIGAAIQAQAIDYRHEHRVFPGIFPSPNPFVIGEPAIVLPPLLAAQLALVDFAEAEGRRAVAEGLRRWAEVERRIGRPMTEKLREFYGVDWRQGKRMVDQFVIDVLDEREGGVARSLNSDVVAEDEVTVETQSLDWALKYAGAGKPVFPCNPLNKRPLVEGGFKSATRDESIIRAWWAQWPNAMIGLPTGAVSGLFVVDLDIDKGKDGRKAYADLGYDELDTLATITPRGGVHLFFRHRDGLGNTASALAKGIDTRGDGGYVILPPSMREDGRRYEWRENGRAGRPAELPEALFEALRKAKQRDGDEAVAQSRKSMGDGKRGAYALAALDKECEAVANALEGTRNDTLNKAAYNLGQFVAAGELGQCQVFDALYAAGIACGLSKGKQDGPKALRATIQSGMRAGMKQPRKIPEGEQQARQGGGGGGAVPGGSAAPGLAADPNDPYSLLGLNARHAVIGSIGGKCRIMSWESTGGYEVPVFQSFDDFRNRYSNRLIGDKKLGTAWLSWPGRRQYDQLVFRPHDPRTVIDGCFNLWRGFGVEPKPGDWSLMQNHIKEILANGDDRIARYILYWSAWAVQHPSEQPEAVIALIGDEGTGRGVFFRSLKRCFGQHGVHISNIDHLTGKFNKHLIDKCFLFADEIDWQRSKKDEGTFLRVVTEPTIFIEPKNIDSLEMPNLLHICIASNKELVVPAGPHARRWVVHVVSNQWSLENADQDARNEYFGALYRQMDNGGCEAMLHDLLNVDLGDWHPRNIVLTEALADQKQRNLDPETGWLQDILLDGILPGDQEGIGRAPCDILFEHYLERGLKGGGGFSRRSNSTRLGIFIAKHGVMKTDRIVRLRRTLKSGVEETRTFRGVYQFPALKECRETFERLTGTKPAWTEPERVWIAEEIDYERPDKAPGIGFTRGYR